jgi:peptide/nickel transport system substrate-binding protein
MRFFETFMTQEPRMESKELKGLVNRVKTGRLSRRGFIERMAAVGLTAPMATQILSLGGISIASTQPAAAQTTRGGGGALKILYWQAPTLLNPHFANGTKDADASRIFYEPLKSRAFRMAASPPMEPR